MSDSVKLGFHEAKELVEVIVLVEAGVLVLVLDLQEARFLVVYVSLMKLGCLSGFLTFLKQEYLVWSWKFSVTINLIVTLLCHLNTRRFGAEALLPMSVVVRKHNPNQQVDSQ